MDKELLKRILSTNPRVIIPSFGAFLHKQQGDAIVFSPFLKNDDGLLTSLVSREYGVDKSDAESMVAEFVAHMRGVLVSKSKYYIEDMGILIVDTNGAISFVAEIEKPAPAPMPAPVAVPTIQPIQQMASQQMVSQQIQQQPAPQPIIPQPMVPRQQIPQPIAQPMAQAIPQSMARPMAAQGQGAFARPNPPQPQQPQQPAMGSPLAAPNMGEKPRMAPVAGGPNAGKAQQPRRRPAPIKKKRSSKNDMWLIIAILAALVVIILMVIGIMTASEVPQLMLE